MELSSSQRVQASVSSWMKISSLTRSDMTGRIPKRIMRWTDRLLTGKRQRLFEIKFGVVLESEYRVGPPPFVRCSSASDHEVYLSSTFWTHQLNPQGEQSLL